jgi:hypothetical protein
VYVRTYLLLLALPSPVPLGFLLRERGLDEREHSLPVLWHWTQTSSSRMVHLAPEERHAWQGIADDPDMDVDAETLACKLLGPISNLG